MYVIVREGVYRHELCGMWEDKDEAIQNAKELIGLERDDYHSYLVIFIKPNTNDPEHIVAEIVRKDSVPRTRPKATILSIECHLK